MPMDRQDPDRLRYREFRITDENGRLRDDILENPYELYDTLRASEPVHYDHDLRGWMLTRYSDVQAAMVDSRLSAARTQAYLSELPAVDRERFTRFAQARGEMLLFCDGPRHTRLRKAVRDALGVATVDVGTVVEATVMELLDDIAESSTVDLIEKIALPLPIAVLLQLLGVPAEDATQIRSWATSFNLAIGGVIRPDLVEAAEHAIEDLSAYLERLLQDKRVRSTVLASLSESVRAGALSDSELLASCLMLVTAGHETTTNLIGNGLYALLRHPVQMTWLREEPTRIPAAIDELLRYDAPVQLTAREAIEPLVMGHKHIGAGQRVIPIWGAANRDPAVFDHPSTLDFSRASARRHLSFGSGRHRCVGASLARTEAEIVFGAVLRRFQGLDLVETPKWKHNFSFRGLQRLVVAAERA